MTGLRPVVRALPPGQTQQEPSTGFLGSSAVTSAALDLTDSGFIRTGSKEHRVSAASHRRMNVQYRYSPIKSHHSCLRNPIPNRGIVYDDNGFSGVQLCGSSTCQHCATKKHIKTAEVLTNIISNSAKTKKYWLLTLTIPTACSIFKQVTVLKDAYGTWIDSITKAARRAGEEIAVSWAMDATFDLSTGKHHLHKHAIVRTDLNTRIDWEDRLYRLWSKAVRSKGGGETTKEAFYFKEVKTSGQAAKYLFKSAKEAIINQSKTSPVNSNRVGWNGLADAILGANDDIIDRLVKMYRDFISAVRGRKWFAIAKKMKEDFVEPTPEDEVLAIVDVESEERIKPMAVSPHFHRALCDSGYLWLLYLVLKTKKDGDLEVEMLRYLVEKYSAYEDTHWQSWDNYQKCIEEVSLWGEDFG